MKRIGVPLDISLPKRYRYFNAAWKWMFGSDSEGAEEEAANDDTISKPVSIPTKPIFQDISHTPLHRTRVLSMSSTTSSTQSKLRSTRKPHRLTSKFKRTLDASSNLKRTYQAEYRDAQHRGFLGTENDYSGMRIYMKKLEEYQRENNQIPFKMEEKAIVKPKTTKNEELPWLLDLKASIARILERKPLPAKSVSLDTKLFNLLLERDQISDLRIKQKRLDIEKRKQVELDKRKVLVKKDLFPPLPSEVLQKVKMASSGHGDVISGFRVTLQKNDMKTLSGSNWLNDEIINFYGELCMDRCNKKPKDYPSIHVFNTFFYEKLTKDGFKGIKRWSKKFDVFSKDYVIIPIHLGMHWCCSVINFKLKRFEYYDSLHGSNHRCLEHLRKYLQEESLDKKQVAYDTSDWTDYTPKDCPHQENGYDCGVFTCMVMEFTAREEEFAFRQQHMPYIRTRIASEILNLRLMAF